MLGRSTYGRPWWPGVIAEALEQGSGKAAPTLAEECEHVVLQQEATLSLYGSVLGNRTFRKHLGWTIQRLAERNLISNEQSQNLRATVLTEKDNAAVRHGITSLYNTQLLRAA
jgi:tRNA-dihydrouridine synthase B